jgi:hypothetical protein
MKLKIGKLDLSSLEFQKERLAWLRKQHRRPLHERFVEVFGREGVALLNRLSAAHKKAGRTDKEALEQRARMILRACSRLPATPAGTRRRRAYIEKCISELEMVWPKGDQWDDEFVVPVEGTQEIVARISRKAACEVDEVWKLFSELCSIFERRWHGDWERGVEHAQRIIECAGEALSPVRYLQAVLRNEVLAERRRQSKSKLKQDAKTAKTKPARNRL